MLSYQRVGRCRHTIYTSKSRTTLPHLPCLELFSRPLKAVVMVTKSWESREEHVELGIGCGHHHNSRLKHSKHGTRHFLKNWRVQVLNAVNLAAMDTLTKDSIWLPVTTYTSTHAIKSKLDSRTSGSAIDPVVNCQEKEETRINWQGRRSHLPPEPPSQVPPHFLLFSLCSV